jgi:hypothetical protein
MRPRDVTLRGDHAHFQYADCGDTVPLRHGLILHLCRPMEFYDVDNAREDKAQDRRTATCCYLTMFVAGVCEQCYDPCNAVKRIILVMRAQDIAIVQDLYYGNHCASWEKRIHFPHLYSLCCFSRSVVNSAHNIIKDGQSTQSRHQCCVAVSSRQHMCEPDVLSEHETLRLIYHTV